MNDKNVPNINEIIDIMRSDPAGVASKFNVPLRTVYGWCNGSRTPPAYILEMMNYIIILERRASNGNSKEGLGS